MEFKISNTVVEKSGGPEMAIVEMTNTHARCVWDDKTTRGSRWIAIGDLRLVE